MMYTTKNLITKSWGHYKISDPELAKRLAYLSKSLCISNYVLYKIAHNLYKNNPSVYDWDGGIDILLIKVAMEGALATLESPTMTSFNLYYTLRQVSSGDIGKPFINEPWSRYPYIAERTQVEILDRLRGFEYFKPNTGLNQINILPMVTTMFRACFIWSWSIIHFTYEEFAKAHYLYYKLLFRDIDPEHIQNARNILENRIANMEPSEKETPIEFY